MKQESGTNGALDRGSGAGPGYRDSAAAAGGEIAIGMRSSQLLVGAINRVQHLGDAANTATVQVG